MPNTPVNPWLLPTDQGGGMSAPSYSSGNPYAASLNAEAAQTNQDGAYASAQQTQSASTMLGMQGQYNQAAQMSAPGGGAYPTFQNSMGLGTQTPFGVDPTAGASPQVNPGTSAFSGMPVSGSTGFNPWSLQGEALSR